MSEPEASSRLAPRLERLRALRSAWGVLAPSGVGGSGPEIAATGRAVTEYASRLMNAAAGAIDAELSGFDALLDEFEDSMRRLAATVPIPQLRSTLPGFVETDRRGLLDLLDVFLGTSLDEERSSDGRIFAIDYLITLLCTDADAGPIRHDPVDLTPRLRSLCAEAESQDGLELEAVESEFFVAASMDADELRREFQQRSLRSRKAAIGSGFFAPRVLRAIVTYNAALLARVADQIVESSDWGLAAEATPSGADAGSLFDSAPLRAIAAAAARRARNETLGREPAERIALALDFEPLEPSERRALTGEAVGTREDLLGTTILIGLLGRSLAPLSIELQDVGIPPDLVSDVWVRELTEALQQAINHHISNDEYKLACAISELKNRFLFAPIEHARRARTPRRAAAAPATAPASPPGPTGPVAPSALDRTRHGIRDDARQTDAPRAVRSSPAARLRARSRSRSPRAGAHRRATESVGSPFGAAALGAPRPRRGRPARCRPRRRLALRRIGEPRPREARPRDAAHAFALPGERSTQRRRSRPRSSARSRTPGSPCRRSSVSRRRALVARLRDRGLEQIMIYDEQRALRVQSLGSQPLRVL
ncbi:MAG: hypothetical protein R3E53_21150 [Myxococcota bacterium]